MCHPLRPGPPLHGPSRLRTCVLGLLALAVSGCSRAATAPARPFAVEPAPISTPALDVDSSANSLGTESSTIEAETFSREQLWAAWNALRGDAYELDPIARFLEEGERLDCRSRDLVRHGGKALRYQGPVYVNPAFRERLMRFEEVVVEVSREIYGRAPVRLRHAGAYVCRSSRKRAYRVSEHALGNAIDVLGFDFGAATRREPLPTELAPSLRKPFQVRVARHWQPNDAVKTAATHEAFLRALAARLEQREDVFRGMIGPSHRDHSDHFHFDMAPWRYVHF